MYRIGLARFDSSVAAVVFDLPGCSAEAPDADAALAMAPIAIAERLAWERRMGLDEARSSRGRDRCRGRRGRGGYGGCGRRVLL
jgi:hypothetical protein